MADDVGFANLPNTLETGPFEFTIMAVGEAGLGKSSFLNTLFECDLYGPRAYPSPPSLQAEEEGRGTVSRMTVQLQEDGVDLALTVVDTPGFAAAINNTGCWDPIVEDIDVAFDRYMDEESRVSRSRVSDTRVHCCVYFISPTGHGLRALDKAVMAALQHKVNLIPVIAKADLLTTDELVRFKARVMSDISEAGIATYTFAAGGGGAGGGEGDVDTSESAGPQLDPPYAVSSSSVDCAASGAEQKHRVRQYPWGTMDVHNPDHCEFVPLRQLLIGIHMQDLIESTHANHYERFRREKLEEMALKGAASQDNTVAATPMAQFEAQKEYYEQALAKKQEEMSAVFEAKVGEKNKQMQDMESKLLTQHEALERKLKAQQRALTQKRQAFQEEVAMQKEAMAQLTTKKSKRLFK